MTSVIVFLIVLPLVSFGALYLAQDGLVFPGSPAHLENHALAEKAFPGSEIRIELPDGKQVHGWFIQNGPEVPLPLLIYYGGNAEDVSWVLQDLPRYRGWCLLLVNYRGFGLSEGRPSERHLLDDALFLYDRFSARSEVDPERIVLMGRSLGSGIAAHVASARKVRGVIMVSPYDSLAAVGQKAFPWIPVKLFLRHRFEALALAPRLKMPLLAVLAEQDEVIPAENSWRLIKAWGGPVQVTEIANTDHNNITWGGDYWESIREFLETMRSEPVSGVH